MICPFCGSQDTRIYRDREHDLSWYLCVTCKYEGYNLTINDADAKNNLYIGEASPTDGVKLRRNKMEEID